ncbi:MAG: exo-alpha-sialidase [Spirochaetia bacterium]
MKIPDKRHLLNGTEIISEGYCDQPYAVKDDDGAWVCVLTAGSGKEGAAGQHMVSCRSEDRGRTWNTFTDIEPVDGPESSYGVPLKGPNGRIYCFYNYNVYREKNRITDELVKYCGRLDTMGAFVFKYSDDGGRTWSENRVEIPVREMEIDREHPFPGIRFFWTVGKAFSWDGKAYVPLYKVGDRGDGWFSRSEGILLGSPDLLKTENPENAGWITLPDGDRGIRAPEGGGTIAEEHSFVPLSDGTFYCVFRTYSGYPANTVSRDFGRTWSEPEFLTYGDGRKVKNPRAANFVWKCANGKYLYWFHNNGGKQLGDKPDALVRSFANRNPVWLSGGTETASVNGRTITWSEPEIAIYDDDPIVRMSYPDLIEEPEPDGTSSYYLLETQKVTARVHEIDHALVTGMWNQPEDPGTKDNGLMLAANEHEIQAGPIPMPDLPKFAERDITRPDHGSGFRRTGVTLMVSFKAGGTSGRQVLMHNRDEEGNGFSLEVNEEGFVEFIMSDGQYRAFLDSDTPVSPGKTEHLTVIVDAGPWIISFVRNGKFQDGGERRQFGWGRFGSFFTGLSAGDFLQVNPDTVASVRIFDRALTVSEAVAHWNSSLIK